MKSLISHINEVSKIITKELVWVLFNYTPKSTYRGGAGVQTKILRFEIEYDERLKKTYYSVDGYEEMDGRPDGKWNLATYNKDFANETKYKAFLKKALANGKDVTKKIYGRS